MKLNLLNLASSVSTRYIEDPKSVKIISEAIILASLVKCKLNQKPNSMTEMEVLLTKELIGEQVILIGLYS